MQTTHHARHRYAQNADHLTHNGPFSAYFAEVVCTLGTILPQAAASPPPNGGNGVIRTSTRRRHAPSQLLMLQNPHRHRHEGCRRDRRARAGFEARRRTKRGRPASRAAEPSGTRNTSGITTPPTTERGRDRFPGRDLVTLTHRRSANQAPPAIRRSCPRDPRLRRGQPRGGRPGRGTGSRTRSRRPRCGRSGSRRGRHRARHTRRA